MDDLGNYLSVVKVENTYKHICEDKDREEGVDEEKEENVFACTILLDQNIRVVSRCQEYVESEYCVFEVGEIIDVVDLIVIVVIETWQGLEILQK